MEVELVSNASVSLNDSNKKVMFASDKVNTNEDFIDIAGVKLNPEKTRRKASVYIMDQLTDIKHTGLGIGERCFYWLYKKVKFLRRKWFTHCFLIIVMFIYTVGGAVIFLTVEGQNETKLIERDIELQVRELLNDLRSKSLSVPKMFSGREWKGEAARQIVECENKITKAFDKHPLVVSHTNGRVWTIWNSIVYCSTLYTTIGYGHLYPTTFTGRVLTIVYSTIGIPLFLIALTDFGKLFTRCIKIVWSYGRRISRKLRRTSHVQGIMKGAQTVSEYKAFRKFSTFVNPPDSPELEKELSNVHQVVSEPQTPALSNIEIDDEFNLPVSLALFILITYMLFGTAVFMVWENWNFFSSFYFIFMSMSTIGFGDIVPEKPIYMILSIIYLCFGLALMSMCINVVQDKLSDTFSRASAKLGSTMGVDAQSDSDIILTPATEIEYSEPTLGSTLEVGAESDSDIILTPATEIEDS